MARPKLPGVAGGAVDAQGDDSGDPLFAVPPEKFVAARNELVSKLQASGNRSAASQLKALARPSVAVWTINQLSRRHPEKVAALLEMGKRLRESQKRGLRGGPTSADELRASAHAERQALRDLVKAAGNILADAGRADSSALLGRIESTLHAIATGSGGFDEVLRAGRLTQEVEPEGFPSAGGAFSVSPTPRAPSTGPDSGKTQRRERETASAELKAAQRAANAQTATLRKAERKAQRLINRAARAQGAADKARMDADRAKEEVTAARSVLDDAQQRIERASARLAAATERR
jgi:hypothetical protein